MRMRGISGFFGNLALPSAAVATLILALQSPLAGAADSVAGAARDGDLGAVRGLIESGADVNAAASDGSTALLWAAYYSDPDMASALLAAGADPDVANQYGVTPLLQASRTGDTGMIELLLVAGADAELAHPEGATPLMLAARSGNLAAVSVLLEQGADPNAADSYQEQTALMWAAAEGHADIVAALLAAGADPDMQARVSSLSERKNADFPSGGFSALMWAARNGHEAIVRQLAAAGADLDLRNGDGATAMMITVVNDRYDLTAALVDLGADVNDGSLYHAVEMRDATTDWYARDGSRLRVNHDNELTALDLIELLLERGADPNTPRVGQMHSASMCCDVYANATPFYRAAVAADVEALKLLIAHGADVSWMPSEAKVEGGGTMKANEYVDVPALIAAVNGGKGVPLSAGPGYNREGPPPFREPSNREPADAVALLLGAGADPDAATGDGEPALHQAVETRNLETIRHLVDAGAGLAAKNKDGLTALHVAEALPTEKSDNVFDPNRIDLDGASPEEIAGFLRNAMLAAGVAIEPAPEPSERAQAGGQ